MVRFMIILLEGSSTLGRSVVANAITQRYGYRHLPIEQVQKVAQAQGLDILENTEMLIHIACLCADELRDQGINVVLSLPFEDRALAAFRSRCEDTFVTVHLNTHEDGEDVVANTFDFSFDAGLASSKSVCDALQGKL